MPGDNDKAGLSKASGPSKSSDDISPGHFASTTPYQEPQSLQHQQQHAPSNAQYRYSEGGPASISATSAMRPSFSPSTQALPSAASLMPRASTKPQIVQFPPPQPDFQQVPQHQHISLSKSSTLTPNNNAYGSDTNVHYKVQQPRISPTTTSQPFLGQNQHLPPIGQMNHSVIASHPNSRAAPTMQHVHFSGSGHTAAPQSSRVDQHQKQYPHYSYHPMQQKNLKQESQQQQFQFHRQQQQQQQQYQNASYPYQKTTTHSRGQSAQSGHQPLQPVSHSTPNPMLYGGGNPGDPDRLGANWTGGSSGPQAQTMNSAASWQYDASRSSSATSSAAQYPYAQPVSRSPALETMFASPSDYAMQQPVEPAYIPSMPHEDAFITRTASAADSSALSTYSIDSTRDAAKSSKPSEPAERGSQVAMQEREATSTPDPNTDPAFSIILVKKKFPCPYAARYDCNNTFTTSGHAARHGKKHTGEKDIVCPNCGKGFSRKDNMRQHMRVHRSAGTHNLIDDGSSEVRLGSASGASSPPSVAVSDGGQVTR